MRLIPQLFTQSIRQVSLLSYDESSTSQPFLDPIPSKIKNFMFFCLCIISELFSFQDAFFTYSNDYNDHYFGFWNEG